jgi:hypothetical protein
MKAEAKTDQFGRQAIWTEKILTQGREGAIVAARRQTAAN